LAGLGAAVLNYFFFFGLTSPRRSRRMTHPKFALYPLNGAALEPSVEAPKTKGQSFLSRVRSALRHFGRRFGSDRAHPLQQASETAMRSAGPELIAGLLELRAAGEKPWAYRQLLADVGAQMRLASQAPAPQAAQAKQASRARGWLPKPPAAGR
jgi:hypothetical protein